MNDASRAQQNELWRLQYTADVLEAKTAVDKLLQEDMLDADGYPTDAALEIVKLWHWNDSSGWFAFIKSIWHLAGWGWGEGEQDHDWDKGEKVYSWSEGEQDHDWDKGEKVYRYNISTAGWSGNESIIRAMESNTMMWSTTWVQSRRGGHYIFEDKEYK